MEEGAELHNVNFFTQIISVQLNLPKKKRVNCEKFLTFKVLNGHLKKQILGQNTKNCILKAVLKKNATVVVKVCLKKLPVLYSHKLFTPTF